MCLDLVCRQHMLKLRIAFAEKGSRYLQTKFINHTIPKLRCILCLHKTLDALHLGLAVFTEIPKIVFLFFILYVPEISTHKVFMSRKKDGSMYILHCDSIHFRCFFRTILQVFSSSQKLNFKLASLLLFKIIADFWQNIKLEPGPFKGAFRIHRN